MLERTLYPRKTLQILFLAAFAILALMFAGKSRYPGAELVAMVGVLFCAVQLLPDAIYLKLTREGFEYKNIFSAKFVKWSDVDYFTTYRGKYTDYVGWVYSDLASVDFSPSLTRAGFLPRATSRFLRLRIDDGFTVNFESKNADALAMLLEEWRKQYDDTTWVNIDSTPR
jgi:hypothetical protein